MSMHKRLHSTVLSLAVALLFLATVSPVFAQGPAPAPVEPPQVDPAKVGPIMQATLDGRFGKDLVKGDRVVYAAVQQTGENVQMTLEVTGRDGDVISVVETSPGQGEARLKVNLATGQLLSAILVDTEGEETAIEVADADRAAIVKDSLSMLAKGQMPFSIPIWTVQEEVENLGVGTDSLMCDAVTPNLSDPSFAAVPDVQKQQMAAMLKIYTSTDVPKLIPFPVAMMGLAMPEAIAALNGGVVQIMGMELVEYTRGER